MNEIRLKRAYEAPTPSDGVRVLVDRLWPRGLSKDRAKIDVWLKEIAPSTELRQWFGHQPEKWEEFKRRYFLELEANEEAVKTLLDYTSKGKVTLVFGTKEERFNNAAALKEFLETNFVNY